MSKDPKTATLVDRLRKAGEYSRINEEAARAIERLIKHHREVVESLEDLASFSDEYFEKQRRIKSDLVEYRAFLKEVEPQ